MSTDKDVAAMLHEVVAGTPWYQVSNVAQEVWGWDEQRTRAAHSQVSQHVKMSGKLKPSGQALVEQYPREHFEGLQEAQAKAAQREAEVLGAELAPLDQRRRILRAIVNHDEKWRRPFEKGTVAQFAFFGASDWQDYASLVVQTVQADTLMNIESKLDRLIDLLEDADTLPDS